MGNLSKVLPKPGQTFRGRIIVVCFLFVVFLIYAQIYNIRNYPYDSAYYWGIADNMLANGHFDLFAFPETFRGYVFPVILLFVKSVGRLFGSEIMGFRFFISILMAVTLGILLPGIFDYSIDSPKKAVRISLMAIPVLYFWGNLLQSPQSDTVAMSFMCAGIFFFKQYVMRENIYIYIYPAVPYAFMAGLCFYAAYNTRAAYLYGIICVLIFYLFLYGVKKPGNWKCCAFSIFVGVIGCAVLAVPQMMINYHWTGQATPRVLTEQFFGYEQNLQAAQVYWGLSSSRYETYIGTPIAYPSPGVAYTDAIGQAIQAKEKISIETFSFMDYFRLFLKYPLDFCGIYTRHMVSLLTPIYGELYITELYASKALRIMLAILLWIAGALGVITGTVHQGKDIIRSKTVNIIPALCVMIPCFLQLFGSPEIRFFVGVHFMLYYFVCCCIDYKQLWSFLKANIVPILIPVVVIVFAWLSIIGDILARNVYKVQLIHDKPIEYVAVETVLAADAVEVPDTDAQLGVIDVGAMLPIEPITLANDTLYEISFDLECVEQLPELLYFDFYGTDYDGPEQDFQYEFKEGRVHYTKICNSGQVPNDAIIRLVYVTDQPYVIENFKLSVVAPNT